MANVFRGKIFQNFEFIVEPDNKLLFKFKWLTLSKGVRCGAVGWVTALQAGSWRVRFLMVILKFSIDKILPGAPWPWGRLSL